MLRQKFYFNEWKLKNILDYYIKGDQEYGLLLLC